MVIDKTFVPICLRVPIRIIGIIYLRIPIRSQNTGHAATNIRIEEIVFVGKFTAKSLACNGLSIQVNDVLGAKDIVFIRAVQHALPGVYIVHNAVLSSFLTDPLAIAVIQVFFLCDNIPRTRRFCLGQIACRIVLVCGDGIIFPSRFLNLLALSATCIIVICCINCVVLLNPCQLIKPIVRVTICVFALHALCTVPDRIIGICGVFIYTVSRTNFGVRVFCCQSSHIVICI